MLTVFSVLRHLPTVAAGAVAACALAAPAVADTSSPVKLSKVSASGTVVSIKGKASLAGVKAAQRRTAKVALSLTDLRGEVERFSAAIRPSGTFAVVRTTKLQGALALRGRLRVGGKARGRLLLRDGAVVIGNEASGGAAETLRGTFKLDPGVDQPDGSHTGTWFQMISPNGPPLANSSSASRDKEVTLLPPGTQQGLRTDAYQPPPDPAFAGNGDSLADAIVDPQPFFGTKFGIQTAPQDPQTGAEVPLPKIERTDGNLSGQITAWAAQWNNQSFNQGTPKPDGTTPGGTTKLFGTFDTKTSRYVLEWKSLIVGGPFNGFTGRWHLEGTFVPAP